MKYILLFLLSINFVFGQKSASSEFKRGVEAGRSGRLYTRTISDTLTFKDINVKFNFDRGWRLILRDSPAFKDAGYEDKKWKKFNFSTTYNKLPEVTKDTIGWLRKTIYVDTSAVDVPLLFSFDAFGAYEFYIDGKPVHRFGIVSGKRQSLVSKDNRRIVFTFKNAGRHQLAFRFLFDPVAGINKEADLKPLVLNIDRVDEQSLKYRNQELDEAGGILTGLFLLAAIIHWFFFFHFKSERRDVFNMYLSVAMLLFAIHAYTKTLSFDTYQADWYVLRQSVRDLVFLIAHCLLLIAVYKYLYQHKQLLLTTIIVFIVVVALATNFLVADDLIRGISDLVTVLLFITTYIYLTVSARKQQVKSAKTLSKAVKYFLFSFVAVLAIFMVAAVIITFNEGNMNNENLSMIGPLMIIITIAGPQLAVSFAISADLAREFVRTNDSLNKKLVEVEQLSAEKQDFLARQNEVLEQQVLERTSALNKSINDLKATQAQLIQSEKLASLGELTAGIAHEIQNPLNFVNNFSEVSEELVEEILEERSKAIEKRNAGLEEDLLNDLKSNLEKIHHHGKRASGIVKSMLEHSRMSTGEKAPADINALADEYLRLTYHGLRAKDRTFNAKMKTQFDENLPKMNVVSQDIGRVLLNIINNAFQASPPENAPADYMKQLTISTKKLDDRVQISIKDNGSGISDENRAKIFQPFFTTKKTGEGTGLGLSLAYDIITKGHGGSIDVVTKQNEGTEFVIQLPL